MGIRYRVRYANAELARKGRKGRGDPLNCQRCGLNRARAGGELCPICILASRCARIATGSVSSCPEGFYKDNPRAWCRFCKSARA